MPVDPTKARKTLIQNPKKKSMDAERERKRKKALERFKPVTTKRGVIG